MVRKNIFSQNFFQKKFRGRGGSAGDVPGSPEKYFSENIFFKKNFEGGEEVQVMYPAVRKNIFFKKNLAESTREAGGRKFIFQKNLSESTGKAAGRKFIFQKKFGREYEGSRRNKNYFSKKIWQGVRGQQAE